MSCCNDCNNCNNECGTNPCAASATNTAACESLPSALENFIQHFFGGVVKTEVDGVVQWILPCDLETGIPGNPRLPDEGLACYFKRLFEEGLQGLAGPAGPSGADGADGNNAYTVTLTTFTQPTGGNPNWSAKLAANPAFSVGATVFIQGSGYHKITAIGGDWTVLFTLVEGLAGVTGSISPGRVVTLSGPKGATGATGAQGIQGPAGAQGTPGESHTETNAMVIGSGNPFDLDVTYQRVVFGTIEPEVTLPDTGTYLVTGIVGIDMADTAGTDPLEQIGFKLYNASAAADVTGSEQLVRCWQPKDEAQVHLLVRVITAAPTQTLQLYGKVQTQAKARVIADRTSLVYVRIA